MAWCRTAEIDQCANVARIRRELVAGMDVPEAVPAKDRSPALGRGSHPAVATELQAPTCITGYRSGELLITEGDMGRCEGKDGDSNTSGDGVNPGNAGGGTGRHGKGGTYDNTGDGAQR